MFKILFLKHKNLKDYFHEFNDEIDLYSQWLIRHNMPHLIEFEDWDDELQWQKYANFYALSPDYMQSLGSKAWWEPGEYHIIFYCYYPEKEHSAGVFCTMNWFKCNGGVGVTVPLTKQDATLVSQWGAGMLRHETIHCFPPQTPVLTQGFIYKPIRDIKPGELVFTHTGQLKKVTQVMKRLWQGKMRQIDISGDYRPIISTREHPFWAIKRKIAPLSKKKILGKQPYNIPQFYPAIELEKGDWVGMPFNDIVKDTAVFDFEKDPDFLWVLGLYLAEGDLDNKRTTTKGGQVRFCLNEKETYLYDRIETAMKKYGAKTGYYFPKGKHTLQAYINGRFWTNIFQELGGEYAYKKKLNERLMYIDPALQYQIFEGWKAGDGCVNKNNQKISVATVSYDLALQMKSILLRNHLFSSLRKHSARKNVNILGRFCHTRETYFLEMNPTSKNSFIQGNCLFVLIKNIKDIYCTRNGYDGGCVYNLEVEDDHSYQVNGVAVHNCLYAILNLVYKKNIPDFQDQMYQEFRKIKPNCTDDDLTAISEMLFDKDIKPHLNLILQDLPEKRTGEILYGIIAVLNGIIALFKKKLTEGKEKEKQSVVKRLANAIAVFEGFFQTGTLPNRLNNPGALIYIGQSKAVKDKSGFAHFLTKEDGWNALYYQLQLIFDGKSKYYKPDMTIQAFVDVWASTSETVERQNYAKYIAGSFGTEVNAPLNQLK